jgi:hypothetical protein
MNLSPDLLQSLLASAVGGVVEVRAHDVNVVRVEAPFAFADGDHLVIRLRQQDGAYEWTDLGRAVGSSIGWRPYAAQLRCQTLTSAGG